MLYCDGNSGTFCATMVRVCATMTAMLRREGLVKMPRLLERYRATFIAAAILAAILLAVYVIASAGGGTGGERYNALIHDADGQIHVLDLSDDVALEVTTAFGSNTIVVEDGAVRISAADCPQGDCTRQRAISRPGEQIICLPHKLWIEIVPAGSSPAGEMDIDAVAYPDDVDTVAR